ncbi:unnamed protein product [Rotaria sordida]|uniref:Uncharacterized protein n=1 Tax=Rotaria sordida TaxID=392033 RepID=A0A815R4X6_9BILA|nr:unnamed protein product [Rotaria sordida]
MKYIITRQFSFTNEKFDITSDSKLVCTVKATRSKNSKGQFDIKFSNLTNKIIGNDYCIVEPDENQLQNYFIYVIDHKTNEKKLFGQLFYEFYNFDDYFYTIIIGKKLYTVRSSDLRNRRLTIIDILQSKQSLSTNENIKSNCPETLFQVIDSFSKTTNKYHVNIHQKEWSLGYLAITILLHLHESRRDKD